jgi:hypothetical protein
MLTHFGFMIDTVRDVFGVPGTKLGNREAPARRILRMERGDARWVPATDLASFIGRAQSLRLAVPDTSFRLRALYDSGHGQTDSDPGHGDYTGSSGVSIVQFPPPSGAALAPRSSPIGVLARPARVPIPTPYLAQAGDIGSHRPHRHVDGSVWSYNALRGTRSRHSGSLRGPRLMDRGAP